MTDPIRDGLVREADRLEEDTLWSSKGHYAASERWRNVHLWVGVPTAALTAIAGLVIVAGPAETFGVPLDAAFGAVAIAGAASTAIMTFLGPEKRSTEHHAAGDRYNAIKGRARRFREIDVHGSFTDKDLSDRLEAMIRERDELNGSSPLIPKSAHKKARKGIGAGEATYRADKKT